MKRLTVIQMLLMFFIISVIRAQPIAKEETRVTIESSGWKLIGDLVIPVKKEKTPVVLMLNKTAGDRTVYEEMALQLSKRGIASLRLDLRGHGESINLGRFKPGEIPRDPIIWGAEVDVIAALKYLKSQSKLDGNRIGIVGGSYSGEEMAEAGRLIGYERAYVELSPGSFSDESIAGIDASGVPWLFITSRDERYLQEIRAEVQRASKTVEMIIVPGTEHATRLLNDVPDLSERIAVWLTRHLE